MIRLLKRLARLTGLKPATHAQLIRTPIRPVEDQRPTVILVHGLGGEASETWGAMFRCFASDPRFDTWTISTYAYPTSLFSLPFSAPLPNLRTLADGLSSMIKEEHGDSTNVSVVAHSLGGMIARRMIVSDLLRNAEISVKQLVLIASPHTGAGLAAVGQTLSPKHSQLQQLVEDSSSLDFINRAWIEHDAEDKLRVKYIIGGSDRVVPSASALPFAKIRDERTLVNESHSSIIQPTSVDDIRYRAVSNFLLAGVLPNSPVTAAPTAPASANVTTQKVFRKPDPLFDVYTKLDERFYVDRPFDNVLSASIGRGHVWLSGHSGIGKTSALRRASAIGSTCVQHVALASYDTTDAADLFRAMTQEIASTVPDSRARAPSSLDGSFHELRAILQSLPSDVVVINVVEELRVDGEQLCAFINHVSDFTSSMSGDSRLYGRVQFSFSSLSDPRDAGFRIADKAYDQIQFMKADIWLEDDISRLISMLCKELETPIASERSNDLIAAAAGSPRYVKRVFRRLRQKPELIDDWQLLLAAISKESAS